MYTRAQHLVNWAFLGLLFVAPVVAVFAFPTLLDTRDVQMIVPCCWLLAALLLADWYSWKLTNSLGACVRCVVVGALAVAAAGALSSLAQRGRIAAILDFPRPDWPGHQWILRLFVIGAATATVGLVSIPRYWLLRLAGGSSKSLAPEDQ